MIDSKNVVHLHNRILSCILKSEIMKLCRFQVAGWNWKRSFWERQPRPRRSNINVFSHLWMLALPLLHVCFTWNSHRGQGINQRPYRRSFLEYSLPLSLTITHPVNMPQSLSTSSALAVCLSCCYCANLTQARALWEEEVQLRKFLQGWRDGTSCSSRGPRFYS